MQKRLPKKIVNPNQKNLLNRVLANQQFIRNTKKEAFFKSKTIVLKSKSVKKVSKNFTDKKIVDNNVVHISKRKRINWVDGKKVGQNSIPKSLARSLRAVRLLKENPNLSKKVFWSFLKLKQNNQRITKNNGIVLRKLKVSGNIGNHFLKLSVGKQSFFVKVMENKKFRPFFLFHLDLAYSQFKSLVEAKKVLKKMPVGLRNHFDVITPEFAFVSGKYSFLVTEFVNLKTVRQVIEEENTSKKFKSLLGKVHLCDEFFAKRGFSDVGMHNMFYAPKQNKFLLFDLRKDQYN